MKWLTDHLLELSLIAVYLVILARHALAGRRHVSSLDDYLVAGRRMGGVVIALSFYATFMSTNTFIGAAGKSWNVGLVWCASGLVLTALACISWFVVAPRFVPLTRQYQSLTVADFLGTHYGSPQVRRMAAAIVAFASVFYLVAIYRGASLALENFLDVPYAWCLFAVLVIVTTYTLLGGFESVVLTDALQGMLMVVGAVAIALAILVQGGGLSAITTSLKAQDPQLVSLTNVEGLWLALAYSLSVGVKYLVEPRQLSRYYGLKDTRALKIASIIAPVVIFVSYLCLLPVGAMARAIIPLSAIDDTQTDQIVPYLLGQTELLGPVASTLFLLVLASAAMSSIDSVLLVAASTIDRDLLLIDTVDKQTANRSAVRRTRIWVVAISVAAAVSALFPFTKDIVQMTAFSGSLYGGCFLPVLVVGLFLKRRSAAAALATMAAGAICVIAAFVLRKLEYTTLHEVYPGIAVGMVVFVAGTFAWRARR